MLWHTPGHHSYPCACIRAQSLQSCPILWDPMHCSLPGSSVHEILQARIPEWVARPSSRGSSRPKDLTCISESPALGGGFFTSSAPWEALISLYLAGTHFHQGSSFTCLNLLTLYVSQHSSPSNIWHRLDDHMLCVNAPSLCLPYWNGDLLVCLFSKLWSSSRTEANFH